MSCEECNDTGFFTCLTTVEPCRTCAERKQARYEEAAATIRAAKARLPSRFNIDLTDAEVKLAASAGNWCDTERIRRAIARVPGVASVTIDLNSGDFSITAKVVGGDDQEVASALWGGSLACTTFKGNTEVIIENGMGSQILVRFDRPAAPKVHPGYVLTLTTKDGWTVLPLPSYDSDPESSSAIKDSRWARDVKHGDESNNADKLATAYFEAPYLMFTGGDVWMRPVGQFHVGQLVSMSHETPWTVLAADKHHQPIGEVLAVPQDQNLILVRVAPQSEWSALATGFRALTSSNLSTSDIDRLARALVDHSSIVYRNGRTDTELRRMRNR